MKISITIFILFIIISCNNTNEQNKNNTLNNTNSFQISDFKFDSGFIYHISGGEHGSTKNSFLIPFTLKIINNTNVNLPESIYGGRFGLKFSLEDINNTGQNIEMLELINIHLKMINKSNEVVILFDQLNPFVIGDTIKCIGGLSFHIIDEESETQNPLEYLVRNIPSTPKLVIEYLSDTSIKVFELSGEELKNIIVNEYNSVSKVPKKYVELYNSEIILEKKYNLKKGKYDRYKKTMGIW